MLVGVQEFDPVDRAILRLKPKLAMRAKANKLQRFFIGLPIDQHKIRLDVAIAMVDPISR